MISSGYPPPTAKVATQPYSAESQRLGLVTAVIHSCPRHPAGGPRRVPDRPRPGGPKRSTRSTRRPRSASPAARAAPQSSRNSGQRQTEVQGDNGTIVGEDQALEWCEILQARTTDEAGRRVYYGTLAGLIDSLTDAKAAGNLSRRLRVLTDSALLVIDEIGYLPVSLEGTGLFFQLINARHEQASTVLASYKGFDEWGTCPVTR